jgi:RNA polymerase sigma factor (sigma-70 family)
LKEVWKDPMSDSEDQGHRLAGFMQSAQDGDGEAYAVLLHEVASLLRTIVGRRLRTVQRPDIEDLVQDILLSLHQARATYDPTQPFMPWLMAITRHRVADGARRYARRASNEVVCDAFPELAASAARARPDPEQHALARAMAQLPFRQQQAIELVKLREMSVGEAAAITGTSVGAIKVAVHRGLTALRRAMGVKS